MMFPLKPPLIGDFPLPCLITGGFPDVHRQPLQHQPTDLRVNPSAVTPKPSVEQWEQSQKPYKKCSLEAQKLAETHAGTPNHPKLAHSSIETYGFGGTPF